MTMSYNLDLKSPKTLNEKMQWLKLNYRNQLYTSLVDKYKVKDYVQRKIGKEFIIPTIGVWNSAEEVDFNVLPDEFVLKSTHDSGGVIVVKNKKRMNVRQVVNKLNKSLNRNYYYVCREWPYKDVKPRIIAEKLLVEEGREDKSLIDYKLYCFNGKVDSILVCVNRETGHPRYVYYDRNLKWCPYDINDSKLGEPADVKFPMEITKIIELAEILSDEMPHARVDFYIVNGKIYFGEFTFFTNGGFDNTITHEADLRWGELLKLPI